MTFGSLFAGIGGMDLGLEQAGMQCRWQVEIDEYARRVLKKHWPDVRRHDDVRTFPPQDGTDWSVDLIAGGFPCQDISYAGKGAGLNGERSGLFYELIRVVREVGPRIVLLENVAALLTRGVDDVLGTLASLGFDAEWGMLPASAFGAVHQRQRIFFVANSEGKRFFLREPEMVFAQKNEQTERRIWQGPIEPLVAKHGFRPDTDDWRISDGFPDWVDRLRGLGNAVVPQVAEWIGRRIMETH